MNQPAASLPTPRTDAVIAAHPSVGHIREMQDQAFALANLARDLERENVRLRAALSAFERWATHGGMETVANDPVEAVADLTSLRQDARAALVQP